MRAQQARGGNAPQVFRPNPIPQVTFRDLHVFLAGFTHVGAQRLHNLAPFSGSRFDALEHGVIRSRAHGSDKLIPPDLDSHPLFSANPTLESHK